MRQQDRFTSLSILSGAILIASAEGAVAQNIVDGWVSVALSGSRILIWGFSVLAIVYAAMSFLKAYRARDDQERGNHVLAGVFAGTLTLVGVIAGWISSVLFPS